MYNNHNTQKNDNVCLYPISIGLEPGDLESPEDLSGSCIL